MMDGIRFREGKAEDRDAVLALRRRAFADVDLEKSSPEFWSWEFLRGYAGPGRFYVAEDQDRIIGHFAFIPQVYADYRMLGALAVDVMIDPAYQRRGLFSRLARYAAADLGPHFSVVTAFQIRGAVLPGMLAGGWRVSERVPVLLKPLSIIALARDLVPAHRRSATPAHPILRPDSIRPLQDADLDEVDALLAVSVTRQPRSPAFIQWRYRDNPHWRYELEGFFDEGELRAFVVHRPAILRRMRALAIVDAGGDEGALAALLGFASSKGKASGLSLAAALMSSSHPAYRTMRKAGFIRGPHRFALMVQQLHAGNAVSDSWSLSWGDTDHV